MLRIVSALLLASMAPALPTAQSGTPAGTPAEDPAHAELRVLRDRLIQSLGGGNLDEMLACVHPDVVITWQNGQVGRGHAGVRSFYEKMMSGPKPIVKSYSTEVTVDELTFLYGGDAGVAFGSAIDKFELTSGLSLHLNDRWTACVVKQDGKWLIAGLHVSANVFDNPLLDGAMRTSYRAGGACLVIGTILGLLIGRRRRSPA